MIWKKKLSNVIVAILLSIAYTIVTLMNIIGPLHANMSGNMNQLGPLALYSLIYWFVALVLTWGLYFNLKNRPELLYFILVVFGMLIIVVEVFVWGIYGSH